MEGVQVMALHSQISDGSPSTFSPVPTPTGDNGFCDGSRSPGAIVDAALPALPEPKPDASGVLVRLCFSSS